MPATRTKSSPEDVSPDLKRKVNTACAACRKRRVRCDRRDGDLEVCTECAQRGFHCVDDENKANKILRRGRKIQELESLYGPSAPLPRSNPKPSTVAHVSGTKNTHTPNVVGMAKPNLLDKAFYSSEFFRRLHIQFPVLDPLEFSKRYEDSVRRKVNLGDKGELVVRVLHAWATSFGVDDKGSGFTDASWSERKEATEVLVRGLLADIDQKGIVRTVSWDGARALLLLLPLAGGVLSKADYEALYHAVLVQVYTLSHSSNSPTATEVVRARTFWYAHVNEAINSALRGCKLIYDQDDVTAFTTSLTSTEYDKTLSLSSITSAFTYQHTIAPIRLAVVCRLLSDCLTGPRPKTDLTGPALESVWKALEMSWDEFEKLRESEDDAAEEARDVFCSAWQIFIFEIYNVVRESLWDKITNARDKLTANSPSTMAKTQLREYMSLHDASEAHCKELVPSVLDIVQRHVGMGSKWGLFEMDAGFLENGLTYLAEHLATSDESDDEDFQSTILALTLSRWTNSKFEERIRRLKSLWSSSRKRRPSSLSTGIPSVSHADTQGPRSAEPLLSNAYAGWHQATTPPKSSTTATPRTVSSSFGPSGAESQSASPTSFDHQYGGADHSAYELFNMASVDVTFANTTTEPSSAIGASGFFPNGNAAAFLPGTLGLTFTPQFASQTPIDQSPTPMDILEYMRTSNNLSMSSYPIPSESPAPMNAYYHI